MMLRLIPLLVLLACLQWLPLGAEAGPLDGMVKVLAGREKSIQRRADITERSVTRAEQSLRDAEAALQQAVSRKDRAAEATAREAVALSRDNLNLYRELRAEVEHDLQRARKSLQLARRLQEHSGGQPNDAAVIDRRGHVERGTADGAWQSLAEDSAAPLRSGDRLRTGNNGGAEFMLQEGATAAQLGADTEIRLTLDDLGNAAVDMTRGAFYAAITPLQQRMKRFEVRTPNWAMAVRGTRFAVREDGTGTELLVLEGQVETTPLGGGQSILVNAGQRLVLRPGDFRPAPQTIDWGVTRRWWREEVEE